MRVFLFIIACLYVQTKLTAQTVTLRKSNAPLRTIFKEITQQTGFLFFYAESLVKKEHRASINVTQASINKTLDQCFSHLPYAYSIVDKTIVIKEAEFNKPGVTPVDSTGINSLLVKGKVTGQAGEPLIAATIIEKGTKNITISKDDGSFQLTLTKVNAVLTITYINKETTEIAVCNKRYVEIAMKDASDRMDEVIVIAYETLRPKDIKASASFVGAKDLKDNPLTSLAEVVQGKLAGVQISLSEGAPGADVTFNLRGRNSITGDGSPLYIVDGVPVENALSIINPQDIESVYVLKDAASTSIYGSRGANGVVSITTKGGKNTNGKTVITYNTYAGVQKLAKKLDMMYPYNFVLYQWERALWRSDTTTVSRYTGDMSHFDTINSYYKNLPAYDWQEKTMGRNALQQYHNVSFSGGNAITTYNLSLTYSKQQGILINSDFSRKSVNFKFDHKAGSRLKLGFNFRYTDQHINGAGTSDAGGVSFNRLRQYVRYRPLLLPNQDDYSYDEYLDNNNNGNGLNIINPLLLADAEVRQKGTTVLNLSGYLQYQLAKNISVRSTLGYDLNNSNNRSFDDTITIVSKMYQKLPVVGLNNVVRKSFVNSNVFTYSNTSLFKSKHALSVLIGQEVQQTTLSSYTREIRYFPLGINADKAFSNLQLAAASTNGSLQPNPVSLEVPATIASFFSTVDYGFNKKYLFKFTVRADGTSIFSPANMWGFFPSGLFTWHVSREKFFSNVHAVSNLKLRLSYGSSGNNRIDPFSYRTTYVSPANSGYGLNNMLTGIYVPNNLGNEGLKWEKIISTNVGVDAELFNGRLSLSADAYYNKSADLLLNNAIPTSSGYTTQFQNIGATTNKGVELQLSAVLVRKNVFSWNTSFNISFNRNNITSLGNNQQILRNSGWFSTANFPADYVLRVGKETGLMYGLVNDGFFTVDDFEAKPYSSTFFPQYTHQYTLKAGIPNHTRVSTDLLQPGSPKFKDINGDGIIDPDNDRAIIGNAQPRFFGGLTQTFVYKSFDLSVFMNFSAGNNIFNANKLEFTNAVGNDINMLAIMNDRWKMIDANGRSLQFILGNSVIGVDPAAITAANANAKIWFPSTGLVGFYSQQYAVEDGSFLRVNNITLGYTLPKTLLAKYNISSLRFYVTANNPFIFTRYSGYDPDVNTRRKDATTMGVDYSAYPRAKTFIAGINLIL